MSDADDRDLTKRSDAELGRLAIEAAEGEAIGGVKATSPEEDAAIIAAWNGMMRDLPAHVRARITVAVEGDRISLATPDEVFIFAEAGQWSVFPAADGTTVFTTKLDSVRYRKGTAVG